MARTIQKSLLTLLLCVAHPGSKSRELLRDEGMRVPERLREIHRLPTGKHVVTGADFLESEFAALAPVLFVGDDGVDHIQRAAADGFEGEVQHFMLRGSCHNW